MTYELLTAAEYRGKPDWPIKAVRQATFENAPFSTHTFNKVVQFLRDYEGQRKERGIEPDLFKRADDLLNSDTVPQGIRSLVTSLYEEGVALANILGDEAARLKLPDLSPPELAAEIKKFGTVKNMIGFYHVKEFFDVATTQDQASLFLETGLIDTAQYSKIIEKAHYKLVEKGHYGVHTLAELNPSIKEFLRKDMRPIVVEISQGERTHGISSISNYTRAAYINSEEQYAAQFNPSSKAKKIGESIHHSLGKEYEAAFSKKWDTVGSSIARYEFMRDHIEVPTNTLITQMCSNTHAEINGIIKAQKAFVGKHALALLDPKTISAMEKSERFSAHFWEKLDWAMHTEIGSSTHYAPHVTQAAARSKGAPQDVNPAKTPIEGRTEPKALTDETQKKNIDANWGERIALTDQRADQRTDAAKRNGGIRKWLSGAPRLLGRNNKLDGNDDPDKGSGNSR
jgi:hypothetical protein